MYPRSKEVAINARDHPKSDKKTNSISKEENEKCFNR
jgi:hypothetical protein